MMKRMVVVSLVVAVAALAVVALSTFAADDAKTTKTDKPKVEFSGGAKGEQVTVTGMFSCTFCTLAHPEKACKKECCASCIKAGDPPSLTDAQGNRFVLISGEQGVPLMTPARTDMLGEQVAVKGLQVKDKGVQVIFVDSIEKAQKDVAITGNLSCTFCAIANPDKPCGKECCANCVKAGDPPLLTDADGNRYFLLTGEMGVPLMTKERIELAGKVAVKGLLVRGSGIQAIYVKSMEKAEK